MVNNLRIGAKIDKQTARPASKLVTVQYWAKTSSNSIQADILVLPVIPEINRPNAKRLKIFKLRCW